MLFIVPFRHRYSSQLEGAACWWPWTTILINEYVQKLNQFLDQSVLQLSSHLCFACSCLSPSALSGVLLLLHVLPVASFLYPTPVLSPWGVLFDLTPSFLNHMEIFGCFLSSTPLFSSVVLPPPSFSLSLRPSVPRVPFSLFPSSRVSLPSSFASGRRSREISPFASLSSLPRGKFLSPFSFIVVFWPFPPDPPALAAGFGYSCGFSIFCTFLWGSPGSLIRFLDVGAFLFFGLFAPYCPPFPPSLSSSPPPLSHLPHSTLSSPDLPDWSEIGCQYPNPICTQTKVFLLLLIPGGSRISNITPDQTRLQSRGPNSRTYVLVDNFL